MTTITFEENIKLPKTKFKNLSDFKIYLEENPYQTKLEKINKKDISPSLLKKMEETKKMKSSDFVNI